MLRILLWNIMAGGGKRAEAIIPQMLAWSPDVIALAEFRGTPASMSIAAALRETGFPYQLTTADKEDYRSRNALLLGSRYPGRSIVPRFSGLTFSYTTTRDSGFLYSTKTPD